MEYQSVGRVGRFLCSVLGTGTFGGSNEFFKAWGESGVAEATRLVDICLEAGLNMFDSADVYSAGAAEEILGQAIKGRRHQVIVSTKAGFRSGPGPNNVGSSRFHLIQAVEDSLRRLGTDYIDLFQIHGFDALTPIEETLHTLNELVVAGKIRYIGCSNFSGWHLMKSLAVSERFGWARYVAHQAYYSLIGRDYEWELMPLGAGSEGRLCGLEPAGMGPPHREDQTRTADAANQPASDPGGRRHGTAGGRRIPVQSRRGARRGRARDRQDRPAGGAQLAAAATHGLERDHRRAERGSTAPESWRRWLDARSGTRQRVESGQRHSRPYPYWHQAGFAERNPPPV